ncbi:MAG: tetratricopeptide repeat protein [Phycisphaerae bacterium]|nr:tetratricopeptide repeat protein [Phycisphaerae bacterium]
MFEDDKTELSVIKNHDLSQENLLEDVPDVCELGDCYASVGQFEQAQECYDRAAVMDPDRADPYVGIGMIALQKGRLEESINAFKVAKRLDENCAKAHCGLAIAYQQVGKLSDAFDHFLKCLEHDTDNLTALLGLFQTSCLMGSFSKVIHYLEVYLDMHPEDKSVMFCLATLYMKDSSLFPSKKILLDILRVDPQNSDSANLLEEVEYLIAQSKAAKGVNHG